MPPALELVLSRAIKLGVINVEDYINKEKLVKETPLILLSEDGVTAQSACKKLEAAGYQNIYVIGGGVEGLLSEL